MCIVETQYFKDQDQKKLQIRSYASVVTRLKCEWTEVRIYKSKQESKKKVKSFPFFLGR